MVEYNTTLGEFGVNCGKQLEPTADEIITKTGPYFNNILKKHLVFPAHHNTRYSQSDFRKIAIYSAVYQDYAENSSKVVKKETEKPYKFFRIPLPVKQYPQGEIFLWHVKKFTPAQLYAINERITKEIIKRARRSGALGRKVHLAIDWTDNFYYGDKDDPMVRGKKPERGTSRTYRYLSSNIVIAGERFTLKVIAMDKQTPLPVAVQALIAHAKTLINIDHVLLDKGFNSGKIVSVLNKSGCNYVMPAVNNSRVLHYIRINSVGKAGRYEIESDGTFTYLAVAMGKKGKKMGYFVNSERTCVAHYKRRWGIETSYRKIREDFLPKTTSKNPIVRLFYFLLAETLYNLWLLSNLIIQPVQGQPFLKYLQTAKEFGYDLWSLLMTNEYGPPDNNYSQFSGPPSIPSC